MKKLWKSLSIALVAMLVVITMPTMAASEQVIDVQKVELDIFKLDVQEDIKVAPRSKFEHCKKFPRPGCPGYVPPTDELTPNKLKCKKAGTCDEEVDILKRLRQILA